MPFHYDDDPEISPTSGWHSFTAVDHQQGDEQISSRKGPHRSSEKLLVGTAKVAAE
jgi:hypothetical protein